MLFSDLIQVTSSGFARLRTRTGAIIAGRDFDEKSVIETKGWVEIVCRERGKLVKKNCRKGFNIWTNTGREYLAMMMSLQAIVPALAYYRSDRIAYIGVGSGTQVEAPTVTSLVTPVEYTSGNFLTALDLPDFPLYPTRTTVRFKKTFMENHITLTSGSRVKISEIGLFTNGDPTTSPPFKCPVDGAYGRSLLMSEAALQAPMAYKVFDPIGKTDTMQLEVSWEIRF